MSDAADAVTVRVAGLVMPLEATVSHGALLDAEKTIPDVPEVNCTVCDGAVAPACAAKVRVAGEPASCGLASGPKTCTLSNEIGALAPSRQTKPPVS